MPTAIPPLDDDACYLALKSRDMRFDGLFFTGVTSTGVYCRPVCRVRTPQRANCCFFSRAAQAEGAGFRPCLRCRPELAPLANEAVWSVEDASRILAAQATELLSEAALQGSPNANQGSVARVAAQLGVSERHLRRIIEAHLGVSPLQWLQTRRLLSAKQLLTDTRLPMQEVALASGFGSLRRFNAAFVQHYGLAPSRLRKQGALPRSKAQDASPRSGALAAKPVQPPCIEMALGFRPPFHAQALFQFWHQRQIDAIESIALNAYSERAEGPFSSKSKAFSLIRSFALVHQGRRLVGWLQATPDLQKNVLRVRISDALAPALPVITARLRAAFDLDADPMAIDAALGASFEAAAGMRVPGSLDGFEIAVRAILGQQVTVAAGRTFTARLVEAFGPQIETPWPQISRCFPSAQALAQAKPSELGALGIVRQRQTALQALSQAVASGQLDLHGTAHAQQTIEQLQALPGIGDWTAQYIAMRALRWPDAFPAGDVALHHALGLRQLSNPTLRARQAQALSQAWRPWRSYAVMRIWAGLYRPKNT